MPRISVYTPTHNPRYLMEAYASLRDQTYQDFEWVLVPNGPKASIPEVIAADERVKIRPLEDRRIGALKAHAVENCSGDLLVELDHDDLLEINCLYKLLEATKGGTGSVFVYSDNINFRDDGTDETFDASYGWETYPIEWRGDVRQAIRAFPVTARSLAEIEFCPNHVRAWTREAYKKAGGYHRVLACADDHDLMCRTYLAGAEFIHIPEVLYFYRRHDANSFEIPEMNDAIHRQSLQVMNAYLHTLVIEWCRREKLQLYDLGGAHRCPDPFVPIDRNLPTGANGLRGDIFDMLGNSGHPRLGGLICDGTVGCFRAVDFMEHIPSPRIPRLMNLMWAALAHGGWLLTETPAVSDAEGRCGWGAYRDPTHVSFWCEDSWRYYTEGNLSRFVNEIRCKFQEVRIWTDYPSDQHVQERCPYVYADLCAHRSGRLPGGVRI